MYFFLRLMRNPQLTPFSSRSFFPPLGFRTCAAHLEAEYLIRPSITLTTLAALAPRTLESPLSTTSAFVPEFPICPLIRILTGSLCIR